MAAAEAQENCGASEPGVLRVFTSKSESKAFYDEIAKVYDLLAECSEAPVRQAAWSHRHFPSFVDCRPIFVRQAIETAGFSVRDAQKTTMWVPVEIVAAVKP